MNQRAHPKRHFSFLDGIIGQVEDLLHSHHSAVHTTRPYPAKDTEDGTLSEDDKRHSAGLMRVNHSGEICAQALYSGQMLSAQNCDTRDMLEHARQEEVDHLDWCKRRLDELDSRPSLLNPIWYAQSFILGVATGFAGDAVSLGFVEETEAQVQKHLQSHLERLSPDDNRSRAIIEQMHIDEKNHGESAHAAGGKPLPTAVKKAMALTSKVMTWTAYYL
jgi:ubiquinone biosynthesis monooxygenase Coq7